MRHLIGRGFLSVAVLTLACSGAGAKTKDAVTVDAQRIQQQYTRSLQYLLANLPREGQAKGAVMAAPTTHYQYHWTRDAALVWDSLLQVYMRAKGPLRAELLSRFQDWVAFERRAVEGAISAGLTRGEPKFNLDGSPYLGEWGRPQNDGPALRALVMSRWALQLLREGKESYVRQSLYSSEDASIIKADLEYTSQNWSVPSFDPWEEVKGQNFYALAMKRKALLLGTELATQLKDPDAAHGYNQRADQILLFLNQFTDSSKGHVVATLNQVDGWRHKESQLDIAIILAVIHVLPDLSYLASQGTAVEQTLRKLIENFRSLYPINHGETTPVIGRYPEDVYDGFGFSGGNPWFLATHAVGEFLCQQAQTTKKSQELQAQGQAYLYRTLRHVHQETGEMSEQMSRINGYLTGVSHLTWSYASFITAVHTCFPEVTN